MHTGVLLMYIPDYISFFLIRPVCYKNKTHFVGASSALVEVYAL